MKTTPYTFLDFVDRLYELGCLHRFKRSNTLPLRHKEFEKFQKGQMVHLLVCRGDTMYVRLVPSEGVQFFFDAYST